MDTDPATRRPSVAMWVAWGLALAGGLAVTAAVITALLHPCMQTATCTASALSGPGYLALAGTATAIVGGVASTVLFVRRR